MTEAWGHCCEPGPSVFWFLVFDSLWWLGGGEWRTPGLGPRGWQQPLWVERGQVRTGISMVSCVGSQNQLERAGTPSGWWSQSPRTVPPSQQQVPE